jgi:chromosome segregation ATPase
MSIHPVSEHTKFVIERDRWEADLERSRQPRHEEHVQVTQTQQVVPAVDDYLTEVDARIKEGTDFVLDTCGEAIGKLLHKQHKDIHEDIQAALDKRDAKIQELRDEITVKIGFERKLARVKSELAEVRQLQSNSGQALDERDREIENLRREIKLLRDEVGLERGLSKLKNEVAAAREQAPNFKSELDDLKSTIEKHAKLITRLRGEASELRYAQQQLDSQQQKNRQEVSLTAVKLTAIGAQTRTVLEALRENGFDLWEMESPSGLA